VTVIDPPQQNGGRVRVLNLIDPSPISANSPPAPD